MKVCIDWRKSFKYLDEVDEYNIDFKVDKIDKLLKFLDRYATGDKRVNISTPREGNNLSILSSMKKKYDYNIAVKMNYLKGEENSLSELKENGVPFFYSQYISNWESLNKYLEDGVSDVIISGELGFALPKVAAVVGGRAQTRVYVNISQYTYGDSIKGFFIRPEAIDLYSDYVDIFEIYTSEGRLNPLYEIFFKDKHWDGRLQEIVQYLDNPVNNYYILGNEFDHRRLQCGKKCIKGEKCSLCERIVELANTLEQSKDYDVFRR